MNKMEWVIVDENTENIETPCLYITETGMTSFIFEDKDVFTGNFNGKKYFAAVKDIDFSKERNSVFYACGYKNRILGYIPVEIPQFYENYPLDKNWREATVMTKKEGAFLFESEEDRSKIVNLTIYGREEEKSIVWTYFLEETTPGSLTGEYFGVNAISG